MRVLPLIFCLILSSSCFAKKSIQIKLLEPLSLNGQEQIIKGETTFEGQTVQVVGKGKGEYSKQIGAIITNLAVSHIVLPGKEMRLSALKKPYLTSFKTQTSSKTASFKKGQALTLNLDSADLKEVLEKGKHGEISEALTNVAEYATSSDREVDLVDGSNRGGNKGKKRSRASKQQMNSGQGRDYSQAHTGNEGASIEKRGGRGSEGGNSSSDQFGSGRRSGWANISPSQEGRKERKSNDAENSQKTPVVTSESTEEGCSPLIDKVHHRVTIQKRNIIKTDGKMTNPGKCEATLENYPIERDYKCEGCKTLVSEEEKVVYPYYKAFWIKHTGEKVYIDQTPQLDRENSYGFVEEKDTCPADIDFNRDRAFPQMRVVYFDRWNTKHEIRPCVRVHGHEGFPLEWTKEGCSPFHEFNNNRSKETHRAIFKIDSGVHEAKKCEATGSWLPHQFIKAQCRPILNIEGGLMTPTARRQITTNRGPQFITEDCEPREVSHLQQTRDGCEGKYFHDWQGGKSYLKKRYYYDNEGEKEFVSSCVRSDEFVNHIIDQIGFDHDDRAKESKPLYAVSIEGREGKIQIKPRQFKDVPPTPYLLVREEEKISLKKPTTKGSIKSFLTDQVKIWERADGSVFEEIVGVGTNPVLMEADFKVEMERRTVPDRTEVSYWLREGSFGNMGGLNLKEVTIIKDGQDFGKVGKGPDHFLFSGGYRLSTVEKYYTYKTYYAVQQREVKVYENGHRESGEWITTGEISKSN